MEITPELLHKLQTLARLTLTPEEEALLLGDLKRILEFVDALPSLEEALEDTPLQEGRLRKDLPQTSLSQEEALSVAPKQWEGFFQVEKVLEE
ncbi:MAG: Asp-tRNA(Asn)/Glu-tRNA(Gln) amidotransferase subunit GatC [Thermaceae bacterium]